MVYINDVSCDKCRGSQYRSARITGEFIGININCITDTIITIESIFQMQKCQKVFADIDEDNSDKCRDSQCRSVT